MIPLIYTGQPECYNTQSFFMMAYAYTGIIYGGSAHGSAYQSDNSWIGVFDASIGAASWRCMWFQLTGATEIQWSSVANWLS